MRRLFAALVAALALVALLDTPAHAVNSQTYSVRACNEHNRDLAKDVRVCLKSYFHRQVDGTGWAVNSVHVYAWTETQGMGDCGGGWDTPATQDGVVSIDNNSNADGLSWSKPRDLSEGNRCDVFIQDNPLRFINSGNARISFTYNARLALRTDPGGLEVLRIKLDASGAGFEGSCVANESCDLEGPY